MSLSGTKRLQFNMNNSNYDINNAEFDKKRMKFNNVEESSGKLWFNKLNWNATKKMYTNNKNLNSTHKNVKFSNISDIRYYANNNIRNAKIFTKRNNGNTGTKTRKMAHIVNNKVVRSNKLESNKNKMNALIIKNIKRMLDNNEYLKLKRTLDVIARANFDLYNKIMSRMTKDEIKLINKAIQYKYY
jgi:hypothetical protein